MRVITKQCRTSVADLHVQYGSIAAIGRDSYISNWWTTQTYAFNNFGEQYEAERFEEIWISMFIEQF